MRTKITELAAMERPIVQGGMHYVGRAKLSSAVSNAGGFGILSALTQPSLAHFADEIVPCQAMTDKPFSVNLTSHPALKEPDYPGCIRALVEVDALMHERLQRLSPQLIAA
jgi:nitronate monooxygenase